MQENNDATSDQRPNSTKLVGSISEAGDIVGHGAPLLLAFYFVVLCNFTLELVNKDLRELLSRNVYARHGLGMTLLFFLVSLTNPDVTQVSLMRSLTITSIIYAWFYLTSKCSLSYIFPILLLLAVAYLANVKIRNMSEADSEQGFSKDQIRMIRDVTAVMSLLISVIGSMHGLYK